MSSLVSALRQSRKSPAVLKAEILGVRSREKTKPIFVFEGSEDIGPYSVWISRCDDSISFEPLTANGKDQILTFRSKIAPQETFLSTGIYFFVDRDFDDLKGFEQSPEIFMTSMYSVENYLASQSVLESILLDEFKCAGEQIDKAISTFSVAMQSFFEAMTAANRRIFYARHLSIGVSGSGIDNQLSKYVVTELKSAKTVANSDALKGLIPLNREPDAEERSKLDPLFNRLDPPSRHRGKFILAFFLKWIDLLAKERSEGTNQIFGKSVRLRFSTQQLSMRSLATRSRIPDGLNNFLMLVSKEIAASR